MSIRSVVCPVHVGRDEELSVLHASADAVRDGGRTLLIGGDAGVGKSRMASEAVRLGTRDGFTILTALCDEAASTAYAPLAGALRRHLRSLDAAAAERLFDGPARVASTLLPELGHAGTGAGTSPEDLHAAVWHLLRRLGATRPVLLLVEDVHWAGADTLRLIAHLVREAPGLPLWLVATYRTDELHRRHPLTPLMAQLRRLPAVDHVRLEALQREPLRGMISALFGGTEVGDEFLDAVRERTEGNPFFIEELCAVLVERGDIFESGGDWERRELTQIEMPETVRETLLARVSRLHDETVSVLRVAALAGERIDPAVLEHAAGADDTVIDRIFTEALDHHLLVERRDGGAHYYAFRHALTREALADDLVGPERRRTHRRLAEALAAVHASDLDAVAAEISEHHEAAGDAGAAADYAIRAARHAARRHAPVAAGEHFERALRLIHEQSPLRTSLLIEAAEATFVDTDSRPAEAFAREARRLAQQSGDRVSEAQAIHWLQQARWRAGDSEAAIRLAREAVALVEGRSVVAEATALWRLLRLLTISGHGQDEARALLPRTMALVTEVGDPVLLSALHNTRGILSQDDAEIAAAFDESLRYALEAGDHWMELLALVNGAFVVIWRGDLRRALSWMERGVVCADQHVPSRRWYGAAGLAWARALAGDLESAVELATPLRECADVPARMVALTALTEAHLRRGELDVARECAEANWRLAEANGEGQRVDPALSDLIRVRLATDVVGADDILERFLRGDWAVGTHALFTPDLARSLRRRGDRHRLAALVARARVVTSEGPDRHNRAAMAYCEGVLAWAENDSDAARSHLDRAGRLYEEIGNPARQVEALLSLAEASLDSGATTSCADVARVAARIAERIGSPPLARAAADLVRRAETDRVLATILVTDIVGSTERAAAMGDRAWRALLDRHHDLVRRELARHQGREIDTAGDGFLAAFDAPARAIRCAHAVVAALGDAGIEVRAGLHTGECEVLGDKLAGIGVHIAARVAALASGGEVLVSATVRDLVAGSGIAFADRGVHALRGVPGEWRLFAVESARTSA